MMIRCPSHVRDLMGSRTQNPIWHPVLSRGSALRVPEFFGVLSNCGHTVTVTSNEASSPTLLDFLVTLQKAVTSHV